MSTKNCGRKHTTSVWRMIWLPLIAWMLLTGSVITPTWAAELHGVRFIDSLPLATEPLNSDNEPKYTADGYIMFQPLNSPGLSPFSISVIEGDYVVFLADGEYKVRQYVDPLVLAKLKSEGKLVQWATEEEALEITVSGNVITRNGSPIANNIIDFPFPEPNPDQIPLDITTKCNESNPTNRKIICGDGASPSILCDYHYSPGSSLPSWPGASNATLFQNFIVFVYGEVTVTGFTDSEIRIKVNSLCNHGILKSDSNGINITFRDVFANFEDGEVIGADATNATARGASISLWGRNDLSPPQLNGRVFNQGTIRAGNAFTHHLNEAEAITFLHSELLGGGINIDATNTHQYGNLSAGQGSEIRFSDFRAAWNWEHNGGNAISDDQNRSVNLSTPSSQSGTSLIGGNQLIVGNSSATSGGKGGSIVIESGDDCGNNPIQNPGWCINEIEGGPGGNLELPVSNFSSLGLSTNTIPALKGNSVYVEPNTIEISGNTTITADEDVVIFGGDDYLLKMNGLSERAITAGRNIILAVGNGGTIDLQGNSTKIFKAAGKVEIYTDKDILLDTGVQLSDLIDAQEIVRDGDKIIYHVVLSGTQRIID